MKRFVILFFAVGVAVFLSTGALRAQETTWVQIEARPSLGQASERAGFFSARLGGVSGFALDTGWFAIALGPFSREDAAIRLAQLRAEGLIPRDSFLSDGSDFGAPFWQDDAIQPQAVEPAPAPVTLENDTETVAEARASEAQLSREERAALQQALAWEGFYNSTIDASFGRGTRAAMAGWQQANGFDATGVLTTAQRRVLMTPLREAQESLGLTLVEDSTLGIEVTLPLGMVAFDTYQSPFARFEASGDTPVQALLISQSGDGATLAGLYEVLQTLEIMPLEGERGLGRANFTLTGQNDQTSAHVYAEVSNGAVKGYGLIWPAGDERRRRLALGAMQASFRTIDGVLPDTAGGTGQSVDLLAGLAFRSPDIVRSGFYVDGTGRVLTTAAAVASCERITLNDDEMTAAVVASDPALGLALLQPTAPASPLATAALTSATPRLRSDVAVSGFSFGGALGAPTLTYGALEDLKGLDGNVAVERLSLLAQDSDAGGPVFEPSGTVLGMLADKSAGGQVLPRDVAFAADAIVIADFLTANGVTPNFAAPGEALHPLDLATKGADLTALVSCWN